jgi:hypothetical protein
MAIVDQYLLELDMEHWDQPGAEAIVVDVFVNDTLKFVLNLTKNDDGDIKMTVVTDEIDFDSVQIVAKN